MAKIISFYGADNKVGTTILAQSFAESLVKKNKKVLFVAFTVDENCDYNNNRNVFIRNFKAKIESGILTSEDILRDAYRENNLYIIGGIGDLDESRDYFPKHGEYFLDVAKQVFDVIVVDNGAELNQGLAVAGLMNADDRFLVLTQQETVLNNYENKIKPFELLNLDFKVVILNKFAEYDPYSEGYILKRLNIKNDILKIDLVEDERKMERERKTFISMENKKVLKSMAKLEKKVN